MEVGEEVSVDVVGDEKDFKAEGQENVNVVYW